MVRVLGILAGLLMAFVSLWSFGHGFYGYVTSTHEPTVEQRFHLEPRHLSLASDGPFGTFDMQQVQRGFQVYSEVCSACHSLKLVSFRDLRELGYDEAEVKKIASDWKTQVPDVDPKTGEPKGRTPLPSDHFPPPFPNEVAARAANNNALPPDLSLMAKAREGGPSYIYSILTGFRDPKTYRNAKGEALPADHMPSSTLHFNPWFANLNIAMPPPLTSDGQVTYAPGKGNWSPTVDHMAQDVAAFLAWTAEPRLASRHEAGSVVVLYLILLTVLAFLAYQNIWHGGASRAVRRTGVLDPENMAKRDAASAEGLDG